MRSGTNILILLWFCLIIGDILMHLIHFMFWKMLMEVVLRVLHESRRCTTYPSHDLWEHACNQGWTCFNPFDHTCILRHLPCQLLWTRGSAPWDLRQLFFVWMIPRFRRTRAACGDDAEASLWKLRFRLRLGSSGGTMGAARDWWTDASNEEASPCLFLEIHEVHRCRWVTWS